MRNGRMLIILFLIFVLMMIWITLWWQNQYSYCDDMDIIKLTKDQVSAGDLFLNASLKTKWRFSWWRHVAIAFEDADGVVKIADFDYNGMKIFDLRTYMRMGSLLTVYAIRQRTVSLTEGQKKSLRQTIRSLVNRQFTTHYISTWLRRLILPETTNKDLTCASFVAHCLIGAGLLNARDTNHTKVTDYEARSGMLCNYQPEKLVDRTMYPPYPRCTSSIS